MDRIGMPQTLLESIEFGMCFCRPKKASDIPIILSKHVKEYLAYRLGQCLLRSKSESEVELIQSIWRLITGDGDLFEFIKDD